MNRAHSISRLAWKSAALTVAASLLVLVLPGAAAEESVEISVPGCRPYDVDLDAQGRPWFTCYGSDKVGVIDPETKRAALYDSKPDCDPYMGAFDASGKYWFTCSYSNDTIRGGIGVIDPASGGQITDYPLDLNSTTPRGIAVDGSGRLYVALQIGDLSVADGIGRFDPATKSWEYETLPQSGTQLVDITVRKSGEVIVCDFFAGGVYRADITTLELSRLGTTTVFEPTWCREAPDGRLWITSHGPRTYVRVVSTGDKYDNYTYPQSGLLPYAIAFDPAGNAWITEHLGNHIHRIKPNGEFGPRIPITTLQSYPFSLAIDQKSCAAWVGENKEDMIAFFPGSLLCPEPDGGIFGDPIFVGAIVAVAGGGNAILLFVYFRRKRRQAAKPDVEIERMKKKKDAL